MDKTGRITISLTVAIAVVLSPTVYAVYAVNEVKGIDTSQNTTEKNVAPPNSTEGDIYRATKSELGTITSDRSLTNGHKTREDVDGINVSGVKEKSENLKADFKQNGLFVQTKSDNYYPMEKNQNSREINAESDMTTVLDDLIRTVGNSMDLDRQELKRFDLLKESKPESVPTTSGRNSINDLIERTIESSSPEPRWLSQENPVKNRSKSNRIPDDINNGTKKELDVDQTKSNQTLSAENVAKLQLLLKFIEKDLKKKNKKKATRERSDKEDPTIRLEQELLTKLKVKEGFPKFSLNCLDAFENGRNNGPEMLRSMINSFHSNLLTTSFTILQLPIGFAMGAVAYGRCMLNHLAWNGLSAAIQNGNPVSYRKESKSQRTSPQEWQTVITRRAVEFLFNLFKR